jgi:hypothetical protein
MGEELPDVCRYATEGVNLACKWAYKGATPGTALGGKKTEILHKINRAGFKQLTYVHTINMIHRKWSLR